MTDDPHIAGTDATAAELERAGLLTVTQREDGKSAMGLTPQGAQVARQMAMSDDAAALRDALLEGRSAP